MIFVDPSIDTEELMTIIEQLAGEAIERESTWAEGMASFFEMAAHLGVPS